MSVDVDSERSRRLLFAPELAAGAITRVDLARAEVREATRSRRVPSRLSRRYQRRLMARDELSYLGETVERSLAARRAVLGDAAAGPPRLLVRLRAAGGIAAPALADAHAVLAEAGVPTLVAVAPRALDEAEAAAVDALRRAGASFAMDGLGVAPRKLDAKRLEAEIEAAERRLAAWSVAPEVLAAVEPIAARPHWTAVAARFEVVVAGAEAVAWMGYHDTPLWRGEAVWMPSYPPFDGPAEQARAGLEQLAARDAALWVPVTLDADAEAADGLKALRIFAAEAAPYATAWPDFLDVVRASR